MNNYGWQPGLTLATVEKEFILAAIRFFRGNNAKAAESLGISLRTLQYKLKEYQGVTGENSSESAACDETARVSSGHAGVSKTSEVLPTPVENGEQTTSGLRAKSVAVSPSEHVVSVSIGEEVQEVLPTKDADGSSEGSSERISEAPKRGRPRKY